MKNFLKHSLSIILVLAFNPVISQTCQDNNFTSDGTVITDSYGDGCVEYNANPEWCGGYDDANFISTEMCCVCGGGESVDESNTGGDDGSSTGGDDGSNTGGDDDVGCSDTNNGATNMFDYDCSFYNGNPDDCGGYDNNNPGAGPIFNAYEMCCNCGGGTDYPYPYDCQDGETPVYFYGGNFYQDIGWEIQNCDGSTFMSGSAPFYECVSLPTDGYQVVVTDADENGWQLDTSTGQWGTLQIGDETYGLMSGGYDLHIGTCGSCQEGQEYIDVFVGSWNNPWEMTWEILDSNGNIVTSGDGYTADGCYDVPCPYTINMFDSEGDGWTYGTNPNAGNISIGDQIYTIYSGLLEFNGILTLFDGNSQSESYDDCTINISEDCENTDGSGLDSYGDNCSSWYDANESPGSPGCSGMFDTDTFIAAEMCCACGGGSVPLCEDGYTVDSNGNCIFGTLGCTNSEAYNFDAIATVDDGSCLFSNCTTDYTSLGAANCDELIYLYGETCDNLESTYNWDCSGCNCDGSSVWCTDASACNFGDESECTYPTQFIDCDGESTCDGAWVENIEYASCSAYDNNSLYCGTVEGCSWYSYPVWWPPFSNEGCSGEYVISSELICDSEAEAFPGCMDVTACNYDENANQDDGSCYNNDLGCGCDVPAALEGFDCDGNPACVDSTNGATDSYGDGCEWYDSYPSDCGGYDDADFVSNEMCCACGGGTDYVAPEPTVCSDEGACNVGEEGDCVFAAEGFDCDGNFLDLVEPEPECENTDNGASDSYGDTCASWYDANESPGSYGCSGGYDTADFIAAEMCCACGGGTDYVAPEPTVCSEEGACNVGEEGDCVFAAEGFDCDGIALVLECEDTDNGAVDSYGDTCASWYDANESPGSNGCSGAYDTPAFIAAEMCCACGGGTDYVAPEPVEPECSEYGACNFGEVGECVFAEQGLDCDGNEAIIVGCTDETAFNYNEEAVSLPTGIIFPGGSCNLEIWDGNYFGIDPNYYFDGNQNTFAVGNKLYIGGNTFYVEYVSETQGNCNAPAVLVYVVTNPDGTSDGPVYVDAVVGESWYMDPCGVALDGCTDPTADNFNEYATNDDDSCSYEIGSCNGSLATMGGSWYGLEQTSWSIVNCTGDVLFSASGDVNGDGSTYTVCVGVLPNSYEVVTGDTNGNGWNGNVLTIDGQVFNGPPQACASEYHPVFNPNGFNCTGSEQVGSCSGCTEPQACNYDPDATFNVPSSCIYPNGGYDCYGNSTCDGTWVEDITYGNCSDYNYNLSECPNIVGLYGTSCDVQGIFGSGFYCVGNDLLDNGWDLVIEDNSYCDGETIVPDPIDPASCASLTLMDEFGDGGGSITIAGMMYSLESGYSSTFYLCNLDLTTCNDVIYAPTDNFSWENSWEIADPDGNIISSGADENGIVGDCDGDDSGNSDETECEDTTNGATDSYGDGCEWYVSNPTGCGDYDDADFISAEMCCACGGGTDYVDPEPTVCSDEGACNVGEEGDCVFAAEGFDCYGNCLSDIDGDEICDEFEVDGCMDESACNYNELATDDDGTCYNNDLGCGCDEPAADDGYDCDGNCLVDTDGDEICDQFEIGGCTNSTALNYNSEATDDHGSCDFGPWDEVIGSDCIMTIVLPSSMNILNDSQIMTSAWIAAIDSDGNVYGTAYWSSGQSSSIEVVGSYTGEDGFMSDEELSWVIYPENYEDSDALYPSVSFTFGSDEFSCNSISGISSMIIEAEVLGCTDESAINFDADATEDDSSCTYDVLGCTDESAINYNSNANIDDGSCSYEVLGCTDPNAINYNSNATVDDSSCVVSPWGEVPTTDCNMTVLIPDGASITVEGEVVSEAWIGVTNSNGDVVGSVYWTNSVTSIAVFGQDGDIPGMTDGETLNFVTFTSDGNITGNAIFLDAPFGEGTYSCNGMSGVSSIDFVSSISQQIELSEGWGIMSTYIEPANTEMSSVFSEVVDNLTIVKDEEGSVYWPLFGLNNIGNLTNGKGYQTKMMADDMLEIEGDLVPSDLQLELSSGWGIMGYLHTSCYNAADMMAPVVDQLSIIKDEEGGVYWPMFGLNNIGDMCPGKGYQVKMMENTSFSYPSGGRFGFSDVTLVDKTIFYDSPYNTGNNMTVGLPTSAWEIMPAIGDEIAAYDESGELIGSTTFGGENMALTVWGDDLTTTAKDGLAIGEKVTFKLWNSDMNTESTLVVTKWDAGSDAYTIDGISIASNIIVSGATSADAYKLYQNVPNPFNGTTTVKFYVPENSEVVIGVYNMLGEHVAEVTSDIFNIGKHEVMFNSNDLGQGTYFVRMTTDNFTATRNMNIVK